MSRRPFRSVIALLTVLAGAGNAAKSQPATAVPPPAAPLRIVVLGDSLALGTGAADPANGLAFRIYRALAAGRPGSEVTDVAIGGSRVADVTRLQVPLLEPRTADLVLLIAGGNDVVRRTSPAMFARDARRLIGAIRTRVPHAALVVFGVPDVARSPLFADTRANTEALSRTNDVALHTAATAQHAAFVDLFAFTQSERVSPDFFSSDDFHPSDAGYERLATFALPTVRAALSALRR